MANKNIIIHPIINGVENSTINLFPLTKKGNIIDFKVLATDINSGLATDGQVLVADGQGGASWMSLVDANANFAAQYSSSSAYLRHDLVLYNGVLYECLVDIPSPEAWDATHWSQITVAEIVKSLNSQLTPSKMQ